MKRFTYILFLVALAVFAGCKEEKEAFEDPYSGAKESLGIAISRDIDPQPASGRAGATVTVAATGLERYKDNIEFTFNGVPAKILSVTDSEITVEVPDNASSGVTSIIVDNQVTIGPYFTVEGLVNIDPTFQTSIGTNGRVNQYFPLTEETNILVGGFTNYDNKGLLSPLNRIIRITDEGALDRTFRVGKAANGQLFSFVPVGNKYIIAGSFSGYGQQFNISNITALNTNGSVDTAAYDTYLTDSTGFTSNFPRFNGGTNSAIERMYPSGDKVIATGNFRYYVKRTYDQPNFLGVKDTIILDSTEIRQIIRLASDGSLDKTFRFDGSGKAFDGANGFIDTYMHTSGPLAGKMVVFGKFSRFDGKAANNIIRLNADGTIDETFVPGDGADNGISSLNYSEVSDKYIITGNFSSYNGHESIGMAMLNSNGSVASSFAAKAISGGYVNFAKQLSSGLIVAAGNFKTYDNIFRSGFMVLDATGNLAAGYNNTGRFSGNLRDVIETTTATQKKALILIGAFTVFDNIDVGNIVRVTIE